MIIKPTKEYRKQLTQLWSAVFGDSSDYIDLLFDNYNSSDYTIFGCLENNRITSCLYAFKSNIIIRNQKYSGLYIYACATYPEFRKRGLLSNLLHEVANYAALNSYDYLCLVPANEHLYEFYSKFGYEKNFITYNFKDNSIDLFLKTEISIQDYLIARNCLNNSFNWDYTANDYIFSVYNYLNIGAYRYNDYYLLYDKLDNVSLEVFSTLNNSPVIGSDSHDYGMINCLNPKLKKKINTNHIYMNIALE